MALRVAINGFGRIGRLVVRASKQRKVPIDFVAVNDLTDAKTLQHLLRYDSVHGVWQECPSKPAADGNLFIEGDSVKVFAERDPLLRISLLAGKKCVDNRTDSSSRL